LRVSGRPGRSGRRTTTRRSTRQSPRTGQTTPSNASTSEQITEFLITALLCVAPLLVVPTAKEAFRLGQGLATAWLGVASLAVASLRLRSVRPSVSLASLWRRPAIRAFVPLAIVVAASGWRTTHPWHFRASFADFAIGAACVVGWSLALSEDTLRQLLRWTIPVAAVVAALGIDQFAGWSGLLDSLRVDAPTARLALTSTVGNPGDLASLLVLPTLLALSRFREADGRTRLRLGAAIAIMVLTIALTATLAAIAAVVAGSTVWWWLSSDRHQHATAAGTRRRRLIAALVVTIAIGALGAIAFAVAPLRARVGEKAGQLARGDINALLTGRLDGWRVAWKMLHDRPLTGVGQGAFRAEYADTRLVLAAQGVPFFAEQHQVILATPHNEALSVAAEEGLPGVAALGWAIWCLVAAACRARPESEPQDAVKQRRALAFAGLVALGILATFWFPLHVPAVAWPWLLFLSWLFSGSERNGEAQIAGGATNARQPSADLTSHGAGRARLLFPVVLVALLAALAWQTLRVRDRLTASVLLARVEARTLAAIQARRVPSTLFAENLAWLDEAGRRDPLEIGVPIAKGTQFLLLRQPDAALAAYRAAAALEPRPEIDLNIGRALQMKGDHNGARAAFARALRLNPMLRSEIPPDALE
jgi:O-antigen ligase